MSASEHDELTAAAIARLANVGRAAVSNWRRRHPDFPAPVGGSPTSPTFARADVEAWLTATGKAGQLATAGRTETGTQRIGGLAEVWFDEAPWPEPAIADLTPGQLLARSMVALLPRSTVRPRTDAEDTDPPVVIDPACSQATLLLAVADRFGDQVRLAGQELREPAAAQAALQLRWNEHGAPYEIHIGDSLRHNQLDGYLGAAAAVVCEPPLDQLQWPAAELAADPRWEFGVPAPRDGELAWMQHCYAHLRPGGVAVVTISPRTCVQPSGQRIRAALIRSGALRDVIALPPAMGSRPGTDVFLWVLCRPHRSTQHPAVRMVDLSRLGDPADVPQEFAEWQRLFDDAGPAICRTVPRLELLDGNTTLLPTNHVAPSIDTNADDLADVTERLQALYARIGRGLPRFAAPVSPARHGSVTLGELERAGALTVRSRDTTPRAGDLLVRTLGRPPVVATGTDADDAGVAQVVELDPAQLDAEFVATFLQADAHALPLANTLGALSRDDLRRCRIPRLPLAEQRRYGEVFRRLYDLDAALARLGAASASVIEQTIHGLITGALAPGALPVQKTDDIDATEGGTRQL